MGGHHEIDSNVKKAFKLEPISKHLRNNRRWLSLIYMPIKFSYHHVLCSFSFINANTVTFLPDPLVLDTHKFAKASDGSKLWEDTGETAMDQREMIG